MLDNDASGAQTEHHQQQMMVEVAKLLGTDGRLDPAAFDRTVDTLLAGGSDPVITKKPEGGYSMTVMDAMK